MTKKQLYILIAALVGILIGVLFIPSDSQAPDTVLEEAVVEDNGGETSQSIEKTSSSTSDTQEGAAESVVINGVFIGLQDSEMRDRKMHQFMLVRDATEVLRIDLRPLIGYKNTDVEAALGVTRGDRVQLEGTVTESEFKVSSITTLEAE